VEKALTRQILESSQETGTMKLLNTSFNLISSRFLGRTFYSRFHVTYLCNYRCGMCGLSEYAGEYEELPLEQVATVADRLRRIGSRHVVLTGGEPFLRKDLPEVVRIFSRRGFSVRIQTNGGPQVTRQALAAVAAAGADDLSVSVDTLNAELQDRICGRRGVLPNSLRTLALARELMPQGMSLANIVASGLNFLQLPRLVRFFSARGIYTYITPVMIAEEGNGKEPDYLFRSSDEGYSFAGFAPEVIDGITGELIHLRRNGKGLTNSSRHLEDFRHYLHRGRCTWVCEAGRLSLDIRPDGRASICKEKEPFGDILDAGFISLLRGREFRRQSLLAARSCSGCFYGEYREPHYAVRDPSVLAEWVRDWLLTFRRGMEWNRKP